jgi:uncharacterized membrane protein
MDDRGIDRTMTLPSEVDGPGEQRGEVQDSARDARRPWLGNRSAAGAANGFSIDPATRTPVESVAQVMGHPLHPTVVPLPIGAFVGAWVADLAHMRTRDEFWTRAAHHLTVAGIATGLLAGGLGAMDFTGRERIRQHGSAWIHAGGNLAAVGIAAASLAARGGRGGRGARPAIPLSTAIVAILGVTGWLGGELSYRHQIGVQEA